MVTALPACPRSEAARRAGSRRSAAGLGQAFSTQQRMRCFQGGPACGRRKNGCRVLDRKQLPHLRVLPGRQVVHPRLPCSARAAQAAGRARQQRHMLQRGKQRPAAWQPCLRTVCRAACALVTGRAPRGQSPSPSPLGQPAQVPTPCSHLQAPWECKAMQHVSPASLGRTPGPSPAHRLRGSRAWVPLSLRHPFAHNLAPLPLPCSQAPWKSYVMIEM